MTSPNPAADAATAKLRVRLIEIGRTTVASILAEAGLDPVPERKKTRTWAHFLKSHWETLYACDFFSVARPRDSGAKVNWTLVRPAKAGMFISQGIVMSKTKVIDLDLRAYFDNVHHDILLKKVSTRIDDHQVMALL